jgi:MFS family permease
MSFYTVIYRGTPALGALFFGFIAEFVGLRWSYALAAAIGIATATLLFGKRRAIRRTLERE